MNLLGRVFRKIIPKPISYPLTCFKILEVDYGHFLTTLNGSCIDKNGDPIPWYTYPSIEYLNQFDFSEKSVFEYGSGNSSLFWAKRAGKVISVEGDKSWYEKVSKMNSFENLSFIFAEDKVSYISSIDGFTGFDIIVIDGYHRKECADYAIKKLNPGGFIILDNSNRYPEIAEFIRSKINPIQVDMKGFTPINFYTSTTSLFLSRDFNMLAYNDRQPTPSIGYWKEKEFEI